MFKSVLLAGFICSLPALAFAEAGTASQPVELTQNWSGYMAFAVFTLDYLFTKMKEITELNKSKPKVLSASLIWIFIALVYVSGGLGEQSDLAFRGYTESYEKLYLFIMVSWLI
jgi:hypothetical protein